MDKKKLNTILIVAVACIWGIVLYKFIAPYFAETESEYLAEIPTEIPLVKVRKKDTVVLAFPERDPFLGRVFSVRSKTKKPKKRTSKRPPKTTKPILWPKIAYLGFVKSKKSKSPLGLLRIDGKLHRVNRNAVVAGLKIKQITTDEIQIINGKEERSFPKN